MSEPNLGAEISALIQEAVAQNNPDGFFRAPLTGFSSAADPLFEEIVNQVGAHHLRPRDILPEVRTVVSFFLPFTKELVKANRGPGPVDRAWGRAYFRANDLINRINGQIAALAAERGGRGASVPATHTFDPKTLKAGWSHRSAAFIAGLGRFGLNRMLIGPRGGAGRYGTAFISQEIAPTPRPEEERCLYLQNGRCRLCVKHCPTRALTETDFDRHQCYAHLLEVSDFLALGENRVADVCGKCVAAGPCAIIE